LNNMDMVDQTRQQSNPYSTGSGGPNFETRVQAAFTVLLLTGGPAPCLPFYPIIKIKLQGRYASFNTDDFIAFTEHPENGKGAKLLAQIKHEVGVTEGDSVFAEVIKSAWDDFNSETFDASTDAFALITGPLSATDINNVRPLLEWARQSETEEEFLTKVNTAYFSSDPKRKKLGVFKTHLKTANGGNDVTDKQLWEFLKVFHLVGYDLDIESGSTLSLLHSLLTQFSKEQPHLLWPRIVDAVQTANQNAGTVTLETLPLDVRAAFGSTTLSIWSEDVKKLKEHGAYILGGIKTKVSDIHIKRSDLLARLCDLTESSNFVFVSGERGAGKSSLIREFSEQLSEQAPVFCLRTEDLDEPHLDSVFSVMGLRGSLSSLEAVFALMPKKYLIIESFEKLLELERTTAFTDLLQFINKQQGWTVVATGREYAYQTIAINFLQPYGIKFETLKLEGFDDNQIRQLQENLPSFQKITGNPNLVSLLKTPFYADLAFRVLETGTEFTAQDGEREFREAVWRDVIAKEQERANGMPLKRRRAFIDVAVNRAKRMVYGVPVNDYDDEAIFKLEADHLLRRDLKHGLVSPAHDMLEDWAIEFYIEDAYQQHQDDTQAFLDAIGHEPAMNRAFRLWLNQKLKLGENVDDFVRSVLTNQEIQRYWQDETMAAILQGDNPSAFLESLKEQLFANDAELLKRFCFILRIACQTPISSNFLNSGNKQDTLLPIFLKPYGEGWKAVIHFLLANNARLPIGFLSHATGVLDDWSSVLHLHELPQVPAREAGLLALYLLDGIKDEYRKNTTKKKLLSVILKTSSACREEFTMLLETDVFVKKEGRRRSRPYYVDDFCEMAFSGLEGAFLCKHFPDLVIRLALFEWLNDEPIDDDEPWNRQRVDVADCFGLHEHRYEFYPPSGSRGPFEKLLWYHPRKGLDFILNLLNTCANKYAHSDLDAERQSSYIRLDYLSPLIERVEITLNDGSFTKQYYSGRLWAAYRSHSVAPALLECALMALENWLISYAESFDTETLEWLFDYTLRNSNSVMPTAVLISVATGFPQKLHKAALPLLRTPILYEFDSARRIKDSYQSNINDFATPYDRDPLSGVYAEERKQAATRAWRKEDLEFLLMRLQVQFPKFRDNALGVVDHLRTTAPNTESWRFRLHRLDSRGWEAVQGPKENTVMYQPKHMEADLVEVQQKTREDMLLINRFSAMFLWAKGTFSHEFLDHNYYQTWQEALAEAKLLLEKLQNGETRRSPSMDYGSIVTAAAVFLRDHADELSEGDRLWCSSLVAGSILTDTGGDDDVSTFDRDGTVAAASVLPVLFDFAASEAERLEVKKLVALALTHGNEQVRHGAANGVREHCWPRDAAFAQQCILGSLEFARFEKKHERTYRRIHSLEEDKKQKIMEQLNAQKDELRDQFSQCKLTEDLEEISLKTHSSSHILSPCLIIPDGSVDPLHVKVLLEMLQLFYSVEQEKTKKSSDRDEELEIHYKVGLDFTKRFAGYLFHIHGGGFQPFIELLKSGCEAAPSFMDSLLISLAVVAERASEKQVYWQLWKELSPTVQKIATDWHQQDFHEGGQDTKRNLIRGFLKANIDWQPIDFERQDIALGKESILEFVKNAGENIDVFEALARLMYYFPSIFFESAIHVLSTHQKKEGRTRLLSRPNTAFCLEQSIRRFLQIDHTGPLSRKMHESCLVLLNAIVETASSRAYFLREHLVRSRKIL
jgi:hypothetical protein